MPDCIQGAFPTMPRVNLTILCVNTGFVLLYLRPQWIVFPFTPTCPNVGIDNKLCQCTVSSVSFTFENTKAHSVGYCIKKDILCHKINTVYSCAPSRLCLAVDFQRCYCG